MPIFTDTNAISNPTGNATQTALQGLQRGYENLNQHALQLSQLHSTTTANYTTSSASQTSQISQAEQYELINHAERKHSTEDTLINMTLNKTHMLALLKVIAVDQQLENDLVGKIVNTNA